MKKLSTPPRVGKEMIKQKQPERKKKEPKPHKVDEAKQMKIKGVFSTISDYDSMAKDQLKDDLKKMGCKGLLFFMENFVPQYHLKVIGEVTVLVQLETSLLHFFSYILLNNIYL